MKNVKLTLVFTVLFTLFSVIPITAKESNLSFQQDDRLTPFQGAEVTLTNAPSTPQTWFRQTSLTLSDDDLTIYSNSISNVTGDVTWEMVPDAEVLEIDHTGGSYYISGNFIYFEDIEGYIRVVYRTASFVTRDTCDLTFGFTPYTSQPSDWNVSVFYPTFYSDYIESIFPDDYTQEPGQIYWERFGITNFPFEVMFDVGACIESVELPSGNHTAHHTQNWPEHTFRRAQWLSAEVELQSGFNPETDSLRWEVKSSSQGDFVEIPIWTPELSDVSWAVRDGDLIDNKRIDELFIPTEANIGRYTLRVSSYRNTGEGSIFANSETTPEFYVIFNPWNDDDDPRYDADVYNSNFNSTELNWYAGSGSDTNYYPDGNQSVSWTLSPYDDSVFLPVISEIEGVSSASQAMQILVDKTRWSSGEPNSDILKGHWDRGFYRRDWRNVPNMMAEWDNGNDHPTGQCMDFGGLVSAFGRAVGVPTRMLTCVDCTGLHGEGVWNFHVWNEMWVNEIGSSWSPADGTYNIGPTTRQHSGIQTEVSTSTGIYTFDARTGTKVNILSQYQNPLNSLLNIPSSNTQPSSLQAITLDVNTGGSSFNYGETVTLVITATNTSSSNYTGDLYTSILFSDYAGTYGFLTYPIRNVTIPGNSSIIETYVFSKSDYVWNGDFTALATLDTVSGESDFSINDGYDLEITIPNEVVVNDLFNMSLNVTNNLPTTASNSEVTIYYPSSVIGPNNPTIFTIPSLAPGETYEYTSNIQISEAGLQHIQALVSSSDAGYDQVTNSLEMLGNANLGVTIEVPESASPNSIFNVTARVVNAGDLVATDTQISLTLSNELSTSDPLTTSIGTLLPGEEKSVTWEVLATNAGVHSLRVTATETSVGSVEQTDQLVVIVQDPHEIDLSASQYSIFGQQTVSVTLTLENFGNTQDTVDLDVVSHNPTIGFTVFHNGTPLAGSIDVPPQGNEQLTLVVHPHEFEEGIISIKAISKLDPNAVDYLEITVMEEALRVFLPIVSNH